MYRKVHTKLCVLCGSITTIILVIMSLLYLYVSEENLTTAAFNSFQNDITAITMNLEQQAVISRQWIHNITNNKNYFIQIVDNKVPYLLNERSISTQTQFVFDYLESDFDTFHTQNKNNITPYQAIHQEFEYQYANTSYYVSFILLERNSKPLEIIIISKLDSLLNQILTQRILFIVIILLAVMFLWIFAYFFTKKILSPVKQAQEEQSAFISAASHELRTPLAVIQSCLQPFPSTLEESTHNQTIILHESKRMATLIEDMLTLSRADNNTWNFTFSDYPPETLLLNVFESFQPICKKNGMSLSLDLTEDNYTPILCDPIRMEQVLAILLNNAISYSSSPNSIELSLKQVGKKVRFQVIDHGIGIPKDQHDKVFKRFYRADASRHETNHFGLGLSIAKEIVNAHNGSIRINDTPGGGTTVSVWL